MNRLSKGVIFIALLLSMAQGTIADERSNYLIWENMILSELDTSSDEETGDSTYAFGRDTQEVRSRLKVRAEEADSFIVNNSNDPILWWIKGELGLLKQVFYHIDLKKRAKEDSLGVLENQALIKEYQSYYRKALDVDDAPGAPAHLEGKSLVKMVQDVLSTPDIKKRAARKALDIGGEPPYGGEPEAYEWYMYELLLSAYAETGDNGPYLDTVNEMIERYPNSLRMDELVEYKRDAESEIEKQSREVELVDIYTQPKSYAKPDVVVVDAPKAAPVAKSVSQPDLPAEKSDSSLMYLLAGGGVVLLLLLGWYAMRRKKP